MHYTRNWLKRNPENPAALRWLLPLPARPEIRAFYDFLGGIDAIARGDGSPEARRRTLESLEAALLAREEEKIPEFARAFAELMQEHPPLKSYARDLISAAVQDTVRLRYQDYIELADYFQRAAIPILRAMLYMCGENQVAQARADALASALQLLGHIRDASDDYVNRGMVYLPLAWFTHSGALVNELAASEASPGVRAVLDETLDHVDRLLKEAEPLPLRIHDYKLRAAFGWLHLNAKALAKRLRRRDPLTRDVRVPMRRLLRNFIKAFAFA